MLEALDRGNLFLVPLDDRRQWYRYHHLFADVLRARLLDEQPDDVPELHRRASEWYEQNGERSEAIRHALAGEDFERAADLVELAIPATRQHRQEATLRRWLEALPDELIPGPARAQQRRMPGRSWCAARSRASRRACGMPSGGWTASADSPGDGRRRTRRQFRALPAAIAVHRAGQARILGDVAGTMAHARRALDLVGEDDHLGRGAAAALLGLAYWTNGDLEAAHRWYAEGMASLEQAGYLSDVIGCAITLADIRIAQGRLREAMRTYEQGLQLATEHGVARAAGSGGHARGHERAASASATIWMPPGSTCSASKELGEHAGLPQNRYRWRVAMARIREAEGDLDGALDLLDEAERLYVGDFSPERAAGPGVEGAGAGSRRGGWVRRSAGRASEGLSVDGRPQLPARVRAHHPRPGAPGPARGGAGGALP